MGFHWPDNFKTVPLLTKIESNSKTCHFKVGKNPSDRKICRRMNTTNTNTLSNYVSLSQDGTTADVDAIILCTGYQHYFPFLEPKLQLKTANRLHCDSLHEGVAFIDNPKMMYIGMQDQWFTFNMFDAQAWYARDLILGRLTVPDRAGMEADWKKQREAEEAVEATDEANIRYQADYTER